MASIITIFLRKEALSDADVTLLLWYSNSEIQPPCAHFTVWKLYSIVLYGNSHTQSEQASSNMESNLYCTLHWLFSSARYSSLSKIAFVPHCAVQTFPAKTVSHLSPNLRFPHLLSLPSRNMHHSSAKNPHPRLCDLRLPLLVVSKGKILYF